MPRLQYQPPAGAAYSLTELIADRADSYSETISELIRERRPAEQHIPSASYLPSRRFARALGIADAAGAGNLVGDSPLLAAAEAARPAIVLEAAGAARLEIVNSGPVSLPVWQAGAAGWVPEYGSAPQLSTATVSSVTASGRQAAARLALSRRLLLQGEESEASVLREVSASVRAVIEAGMLAGSGSSNQPLGITSTPGTGAQSFAGSLPTFTELALMIEKAADADADLAACSWILNTKDLAGLINAQRGTAGPPVIDWSGDSHRIGGFVLRASRHMPEGTAVFGDFSSCTICYWGEAQLVVDRYSNGKSLAGAVDIVIHNLVDLLITHPEHLVVGGS